MIIGIDPGHGGIDPGAVGPCGTREANIVLDISMRLAKALESQGHSVVLTRRDDESVSLRDRVQILNETGCSLVLSIHINAFDSPDPDYISAWICGRGGEAEKLAAVLTPELAAATGWPDGGVRVKGFYVLRKTEAPAVLLELGFISNPEQERQLTQTCVQNNIVETIGQVLSQYLSIFGD